MLDVADNGKLKLSRRAAQLLRKESPGDTSRDIDSGAMLRAAMAFPGAVQMGNWLAQNGYPKQVPEVVVKEVVVEAAE